ncbi:hypothetical protein [Methylopila sp. 73B]|uniref:hypothetical protein n=1 Tax=Methylopila sp. 73B TaxID=1120792 RepID=UPI00035FD27C|nr:hypothetical protein [Methylopila sp. 73B]
MRASGAPVKPKGVAVLPKDPRQALTVPQFCTAVGISRCGYYKLKAQGLGPREMRLGASVRISPEALLDWQRERESPTGAEAEARLQNEKRARERARRAVAAVAR